MQLIIERVQAHPQRIVFAEGEEEKGISAAIAWRNQGLGTPILIGREDRVAQTLQGMGIGRLDGVEIHNARLSEYNPFLPSSCIGASSAWGCCSATASACQPGPQRVRRLHGGARPHADAMVTGLTRTYHSSLEDVLRVVDPRPTAIAFSG